MNSEHAEPKKLTQFLFYTKKFRAKVLVLLVCMDLHCNIDWSMNVFSKNCCILKLTYKRMQIGSKNVEQIIPVSFSSGKFFVLFFSLIDRF